MPLGIDVHQRSLGFVRFGSLADIVYLPAWRANTGAVSSKDRDGHTQKL